MYYKVIDLFEHYNFHIIFIFIRDFICKSCNFITILCRKRKTGTRIPGTCIRPECSGIYRVVLAPYRTQIRNYSIRILPISVPNIKIPESVSEKTDIYTISIRYPTGILDPFSSLPTVACFVTHAHCFYMLRIAHYISRPLPRSRAHSPTVMAHYPACSPPPLLVLAVSPSTINGWRRLFLSGTPRPLSSVAIKLAIHELTIFPSLLVPSLFLLSPSAPSSFSSSAARRSTWPRVAPSSLSFSAHSQ
jgi:hypothetical protein